MQMSSSLPLFPEAAMASSRLKYLFTIFAVVFSLLSANASPLQKRTSRTSPPSGAVVVRQTGTLSGEFTTVQAAVNSLPNDSSARTIFIYPGKSLAQFFIFPAVNDVN